MNTKRDDLNNAKPLFRTAFNYDKKAASTSSGLTCPEPTRTQQHQRDETDINVIVQRFGVTGVLPQSTRVPQYGDFFAAGDYQTCLNLIIQAQDSFMELPAKTRAHFNHDPAAFLAFLEASPDAQLALDLGIAHVVSRDSETPKPEPAGHPATGITQPPA